MSLHIDFHQDVYTIPDEVIPGNSTSETPCRFHLSMASDADLARIKSIVFAKMGLDPLIRWSPAVQKAVSSAFETGKDAFVRTVDKVDGLTVPLGMARRVGLVPKFTPGATDITGMPDDTPFPIRDGYQFSKVAPYMLLIGFLVAAEITKLTDKGSIDPRFFELLSGLSTVGLPVPSAAANSTAVSASQGRGKAATADFQKAKPASRRNGTSRRK